MPAAVISVVLIPKKETWNGSREEPTSLALYARSEKNTGMPLQLKVKLCPCVAEPETFLHGEGERV